MEGNERGRMGRIERKENGRVQEGGREWRERENEREAWKKGDGGKGKGSGRVIEERERGVGG